MKKKRIVILIFFLVVGAGAWWYFRRVNAPPSYETTQVVRGDLRETVSASATLVAEQEIDLNFEMTGRIASVSVKVGEDVAAGEPVARLESKTFDGQIASAKAAVDRASAESLLREETTREASRAQRMRSCTTNP
ncbi:MAG: biotin/lipoyl-binding protein [Candidatus Moraniibacteriota bacterium]|nr:MAG: biotin/lipoyl-binding protein [Candidatus Moranbacteria bacterium]